MKKYIAAVVVLGIAGAMLILNVEKKNNQILVSAYFEYVKTASPTQSTALVTSSVDPMSMKGVCVSDDKDCKDAIKYGSLEADDKNLIELQNLCAKMENDAKDKILFKCIMTQDQLKKFKQLKTINYLGEKREEVSRETVGYKKNDKFKVELLGVVK